MAECRAGNAAVSAQFWPGASLLLVASACGAAVALHSQPLELAWLREFIRTQLSDGAYPQLVLRIGLVTQVAASVRREPADVLVPEVQNPISAERTVVPPTTIPPSSPGQIVSPPVTRAK